MSAGHVHNWERTASRGRLSVYTCACGATLETHSFDPVRAQLEARWAAETDPVEREAYALAKRAGFDWYDTESAARRIARCAAAEILALRRNGGAR